MAVVAKAAEQGLDEVGITEEAGPLGIVEVRGDDGWVPLIAFLKELEEDVALLRTQIQISELVDDDEVEPRQIPNELSSRAISQGRIHFVEQVLGLDEESAVAVLQGFEQQAGGDSGLAYAGLADEDDILGLGNEAELGGNDSIVQLSGMPARLMRVVRADSWR